uniref:Zinc finger protein 513 n=1 Tax=Cacopsylla melanoneura TaxID=428564 RepID=A0A8D8Q4F9_9HEMI
MHPYCLYSTPPPILSLFHCPHPTAALLLYQLSCIHCGEIFPPGQTELSLVGHGAQCSGAVKFSRGYVCFSCNYSTPHKNSLGRHVRIHTGRKPHACGSCEYSTINLYDLKRHMMRHTGLKPFSCVECGFKTNQKCNLRTHVRLRHLREPVRRPAPAVRTY